jgi:hypothetical protein
MRRSLPRRSLVLALSVEARVAGGALVDRRRALRLERVRVVAGGQEEVAGGVPGEVAAVVAADAAVLGDLEQLLLGGEVERLGRRIPLEAREVVDAAEALEVGGRAVERGVARRGVERGRVVDVHPPVGLEVGVERDRLQAVLVVAVDRNRGRDLRGAVRVGVAERAVARGVQDALVGEHGEADRLAGLRGALGQRDALEVAPLGAAALARDEVGRPLDAADQVRAELRLRVGLGGVAAAGVPGAPAVVVLAPGDRVVDAHRAGAGVVGGLVERGQHVHVAARVLAEAVPLVVALPALREARRRGVLGV